MLLHLSKQPTKAFIHNRLPLKYLNSYSNFLRVRTSIHKRSYIQTTQLWYMNTYKKSILQKNTYTLQSRLKFLRRSKVRNLKSSYTHLQSSRLQPLGYQHNVVLFKNKLSLFNNSLIRFKKKHPKISNLNVKLNTPLRRKRVDHTYKFLDKQILNRYKTHYFHKTPTMKPKLLNLIIQRSFKRIRLETSLSSVDSKFSKIQPNLRKLYTSFENKSLIFKAQAFKSFILRNSGLYIISKLS